MKDVGDRYVQALHEIALSAQPVDVELRFAKPPRSVPIFSDTEPPIGPRASLRNLRIVSNARVPRPVERLYNDVDARAEEAIIELYRSGIPVSMIQRLLSVGALGKKNFRRLVPTRWSITAVDDAVSRYLVAKIRSFPEIDSVYFFYRKYRKNLFVAIFVPGKWSFEWMEAWFPNTTWNRWSSAPVIEGDHELYMGRKDYASIGGCYYATRLAVAEYLYSVGSQATVVVLREIYPGFDIPIGVWFVRENVRAMLREKPVKVRDLGEALKLLDRVSVLGAKTWASKSVLLRNMLKLRRLDSYIRGSA